MEVTFALEQRRAVAWGVMETAGVTFLLLIAVRRFTPGPTAKALITAGGSLGLMATPFTVWAVSRLRWSVSRAAAWMARAGALCYLVAAAVPDLAVYTAACIAAMTCGFALIPLITQMLEENYPRAERGRRFSFTVIIRILAAMSFSWVAGLALSRSIALYPAVILSYAAAFLYAAHCLERCPTGPISRAGGSHPFRAWRYVRDDAVFRTTLISWMLMGIGNLMMLPLRVEYLANPKYGLALPAARIALLTGVLPNVTRLLMILVWGRLFDRMNFFVMRAILNVGFALNILLFFSGDSIGWQVAASVIFGVASAGGDISWSLWVTKIAPPARTADYMSVHTFLNGIRSAFAPFLAFWFVEGRSMTELGWISAGLIGIATLLLVPEFRARPRIPADAPV